ncbi:MAG: CoA transferase [Rhodospirillaceae bacterium]|nr:CoA transferase [Magnetovibrio sp.]MAY65641.1 CoA transferase [Rhodospirillaceae bacterium]
MTTRSALQGITVLDMSRVLAGPSSTQLLGDLGAEVIKVERRGVGDETRTWGPPYMKDAEGADSGESAYYLSANRNKRSVTVDISKPEGVALIRRMLAKADVLIENLKVGGMAKYGLGYDNLKADFPGLVYCSITGYGQTGPYAPRPGYDMMAQGLGGLISMTGEPGRLPVKVPIAVNDVMTGMYATVAILAALRHRDATGEGQYIDLGLLDVQVGWLYNQGMNYLIGGTIPERLGTAHPNTVPYQAFETKDGFVIMGANNDDQFRRFCEMAGAPELATDPRFATNPDRLKNRDVLIAKVQDIMHRRTSAEWINDLSEASLPVCPINSLDQVFADPHVQARGMKISMPHGAAGGKPVDMIGNPIKMSGTPVSYRRPPPTLGEHTDEVLSEIFGLSGDEISRLHADEII